MHSVQSTPDSPTLDRKIRSVTWPMAVIAGLMLVLCIASLSALSSIRAFVNGEGMWSKAERQSVAELREYARTENPEFYRRFREELLVNLGDHAARLELQSPDPSYVRAARGFIAGRNHPADVPGMMRLFRLFRNSSVMAPPIAAWTEADSWIAQLDEVGQQLHATIAAGPAEPAHVARLLAIAELVHRRVAPLEDQFSTSLGQTSRLVLRLLTWCLALCSAVLVGIGAAISRASILRGERISAALREARERAFVEQARAHVTLESITDAVVCTDLSQRVTYMNGAAEQLSGWLQAEAQGRPLATVLTVKPEPNAYTVTTDVGRIVRGELHSGSATGSLLQRRDGSLVPIHERAARICDSHGDVIGVVLVLRDITQERELSAQLQHQATHDSLTGLANRREFERRLRMAIDERRGQDASHALLYLDLDQFKVVNDTCGHKAGDELICQVAGAVRQSLRNGDLLARLGGDEFGVLLAPCSLDNAVGIAEAIRRRIGDQRFHWEDKVFVVNASIGVLSLADSEATVDGALSAADQACYLAKDNGRNRVQVFRPDDQEMRARQGEMQWVERINEALDRDRFVLYAQDICRLGGRPASGNQTEAAHVEVLIRMLEADGTLIAPMAFIPAAERYGLMPRVDRWVIANACRNLAQIRARDGALPTCMINLSGRSVTDPSLADFVRENLDRYALPGHAIGFEMTETAAIANVVRAAAMMNQLKQFGCPILLDDFGSGMSSFGYLRGLPVDFLKIDGEFVKDMMTDPIDYAVVEAVHRIGRVMGVKTVAESVESEAVLAALLLVGVDFAQGFHLGRPVPMLDWVRRTPAALPVQSASASAGRSTGGVS